MRHVSRQQSNPVGLLILIVAVIVAYPLAIASGSIPPTSVETIQLRSKLVNATLPYSVILPADYRTALVMHDVEGLSNPDIAETLGISLPAVKSRVHRSRLWVRKQLADYLQPR